MDRKLVDERTESINGKVSFFCLMLTQISLVSMIFYKRYVLGLPQESISDIAWIAFLSMAGYWMIRLYFSGILPVISLRKLVILYIGLVAAISVPIYYIHGWPNRNEWYEVLYPAIGVAVFLVFYYLVAYFGKRRIDEINKLIG